MSANDAGFWKRSKLYSTRRTEMAKQLQGKDMRVVESMQEGSLPDSTDADGSVKGALKYNQLGADACSKVLEGLLAP